MLTRCAISGCHNELSYNGAGGVDLTSWDNMFKGSGTGAIVIPYRPDFSSLCFFTNVDTTLGIVLPPTMPIYQNPLTRTEYLLLKNWIANGAPSSHGKVKFADDPQKRKLYVTNRLCNVVTVFDVASLLQMRYIDVGNGIDAKYPYCIKVSPDKKYWYVSFFSQTNIIQKFSTDDDHLVSTIDIGTGSWTSFEITADSKFGYFVNNSNPGKIAYVDLDQNKLLTTYVFNDKFNYPKGIACNETAKKMYVGCSNGNYIYVIDIKNPLNPVIKERPIDGSSIIKHHSSINATDLLMDVNNDKCYIACEGTSEIRIVNMDADTLFKTITLGSSPAFMALSVLTQKLFITCPDDIISFPGNRGSVVALDVASFDIYKKIKTGYQPYGLCIIDEKKIVAIVNANISSAGPASHHVSKCGQKNGNLTFIDLNTFTLLPNKKPEVAVYPFGIANK